VLLKIIQTLCSHCLPLLTRCSVQNNPNPLFTPLLTWCSVQFSAQKPAAYAAYAYAYAHPVQNNLVWPCCSRNIPEQPCMEHESKFFLLNIMNWIKVPINKETKSTGNVWMQLKVQFLSDDFKKQEIHFCFRSSCSTYCKEQVGRLHRSLWCCVAHFGFKNPFETLYVIIFVHNSVILFMVGWHG